MTNSETQAAEAVMLLLGADEDTLFAELGIRATALAEDPAVAGSFDPPVIYNEAQMGAMDDVRALGRRLFRRWNRELHALICGHDPDDETERKQVAAAIGLGQVGFAAYLATLLVSCLGLAPAIAAVVAAILVRRLFRPGLEELCAAWGESFS